MTVKAKLNPLQIMRDFLPHDAAQALEGRFKDQVNGFFQTPQLLSHNGKTWAVSLTPTTSEGKATGLFARIHADRELYIWKLADGTTPNELQVFHLHSALATKDSGSFNFLKEAPSDHLFLTEIFKNGVLVKDKEMPKISQLDAKRLEDWLTDQNAIAFLEHLSPPKHPVASPEELKIMKNKLNSSHRSRFFSLLVLIVLAYIAYRVGRFSLSYFR